MSQKITVETVVDEPIEKVWKHWNDTLSITKWAFASDDWECPHAENDVQTGGKFLTRMSAKDGSASFDVIGTYTFVRSPERISYIMPDGREVDITFEALSDTQTKITETFDMEHENTEELQRNGWQAILENFKKFVENQ